MAQTGIEDQKPNHLQHSRGPVNRVSEKVVKPDYPGRIVQAIVDLMEKRIVEKNEKERAVKGVYS